MRLGMVLLIALACASGCRKKQAYKIDDNFVGLWQSNISLTEGYQVRINDGRLGSSYEYVNLKNHSSDEDERGTAWVDKRNDILIIGEKELAINEYPEIYLETTWGGETCQYWRIMLDDRIYDKELCE